MGLADSRSSRQTVMDSRKVLNWDSQDRASQVPGCSVGIRRPQPPRGTAMLHVPVASHHVLASPSLVGCPSRASVTRPNRVHALALRLTPTGASCGAPGLPPERPRHPFPTLNNPLALRFDTGQLTKFEMNTRRLATCLTHRPLSSNQRYTWRCALACSSTTVSTTKPEVLRKM